MFNIIRVIIVLTDCGGFMGNLLKEKELLMSKYNYEKNKNVDLDKLTTGTHKKIWWKCLDRMV